MASTPWPPIIPLPIDELAETVALRVAEGHALYPRASPTAAGTALDYGGIPSRPGVAIDVRGLDRIVDYPVADMTVTVEAGITLNALRLVLAEYGQRLWVDAPQADRATLGGIYATDTSGPRRFGLGRPRDQILGIPLRLGRRGGHQGGRPGRQERGRV